MATRKSTMLHLHHSQSGEPLSGVHSGNIAAKGPATTSKAKHLSPPSGTRLPLAPASCTGQAATQVASSVRPGGRKAATVEGSFDMSSATKNRVQERTELRYGCFLERLAASVDETCSAFGRNSTVFPRWEFLVTTTPCRLSAFQLAAQEQWR